MKRNFYASLLLFVTGGILLSACGESKSKGFTLSGNIKGISSGTIKLISSDMEKRTSTTVDSVALNEGRFSFSGNLEQPRMMSLLVEPGNWGFEVFLENGMITIEADTSGARHYDWTSYGGVKGATITHYTVTGSDNHDIVKSFENYPPTKAMEPMFEKLNKAYESATDRDEGYAIKEQMDSLSGLHATFQKQWLDSFINVNPSSAAGPYLYNNYYTFHQDLPILDMEKTVSTFSGDAVSTVYFNTLSSELQKRQALMPGKQAPDFTLLKPDSSSFTLSSLHGQYVLLDFWASWCVPCRKAIPHWKEVYNKYHDKGLEIVGVTNDSDWKDWSKALDQEKMPWLQVADEFPLQNMPSRVGTMYMTPYLPTYILLDKEGKIILHNASKDEIDLKLKELL